MPGRALRFRRTNSGGYGVERLSVTLISQTPPTFSYKGGDPAAGSPTATLLRLHPNHEPYLGRLLPLRVSAPASSAVHFRDVTGGVYKARERIHRSVLIYDYYRFQLHGVELQTPILTDAGFFRLAPPCGFATVCTDHCSTCVALDIKAMRT